jgi:tetratricopeptide (TPR) repeat protein
MTRRGKRGAALAAISGAALLLGSPCRAAGPYPQAAQPDLSRLTFAPSLATGAAPANPARDTPPARASAARNADRARTERPIAEQLDLIHEHEVRDGIFSRDLAAELARLAALYQERGEHDVALGLLDRARQIIRVNDGLFTLDQAPMIRQAMASHEALEQRDGEEQSLNELLRLARRNPNDVRIAEIYDEVADARVAEVEQFLRHETMPPIHISVGLDVGGTSLGESPGVVAFGGSGTSPGEAAGTVALRTLRDARLDYFRAIRAIVTIDTRSVDAPSLHALEADVVKTYYLQAQYFRRFMYQQPTRADRDLLHGLGANSYVRRIRYSEAFRSPDIEIASELLELGDWHLWFGARELAFAAYRGARDVLVRDGATPAELTAFFSPTTATVLPTFAAGFVDADEAAAYKGYVGVAITLDGAGRSTRVDVTERSIEATDEIVQRLKKHVAKSVFRPRFEDGDWLGEDRVSLRYYFTY